MNARRPGQWPTVPRAELPEPDDQGARHRLLVAEQARFHVTLGAIRADLEAQPSEMCLRSAARRWQQAITQLADELGQQLKNAG